MGPNGSGKSTLAQVLAGREELRGHRRARSLFEGQDLLEMDPEERAREGVFLAFQYPVEIPGVSNTYFLKAALNAMRKHRGQPELDAVDFLALVREKMKLVQMDETLLKRPVNEGFSGGEKKRNEIFQMAVLEPQPGDPRRDRLRPRHRRPAHRRRRRQRAARRRTRSFLVITHYQRLLNYIVPDFVHVLLDGRIVRSGGKELALELEEKGYAWLEGEVAPAVAADRPRVETMSGAVTDGAAGASLPRAELRALPARAAGRRAWRRSAPCAGRRSSASPSSASRPRGRRSGASPTWRRSPAARFERADGAGPEVGRASAIAAARASGPAARLVFVDGRFAPELSLARPSLPAGVVVGSLAEALAREPGAAWRPASAGTPASRTTRSWRSTPRFFDDGAFVDAAARRGGRGADPAPLRLAAGTAEPRIVTLSRAT